MDCSCLIRMTLFGVLLLVIPTTEPVNGQFILTVNFINYTNPTGLCAECETRLESVTGADQLVPVCCDESPSTSSNCDNTGEARCETRFRWTIRPFGASLETRPVSVTNATTPPYYFTDCNLPNATCPFSEKSTTFSQGPTGFLGVAANPLPVIPRTNMLWTGSIQFFIEAVDSRLPNIIDSLLINLDNLQLGADFIEEMTFTGYHNISHMTMSFRVACQTGFCGRDCTTTRLNNPHIFSCNTNGEVVCLSGRNISTNCTTCLSGYAGENCVPDTAPSLSVALIGGIAGGVVVLLIIIILVITVVIVCLCIQTKNSCSKNANTTTEREPVETIQMEQNPVYDVTTAVPPQPSTDDTDAIQLQPNVLYGVSIEPDRCDQTTYYENEGLGPETNCKKQHEEYDYIKDLV